MTADLALMRTAAFVDLGSKEDRKRSAALLADLFIEMNRAAAPKVAFEIGAYEGTFARRVSRAAPEATVFAFEANPHCFSRFGRPERWEKIDVEYLHLAVSDEDGEATFHILREVAGRQEAPDGGRHSLSPRLAESETDQVTVPATTLDSFVADRDLVGGETSLWIDVEGAIGKVLAGADRTLEDVALLLCEVESRPVWDEQWLWPDVHRYLIDRGFVAVARDFEFSTQFNVVFVRADRLDGLTPLIEQFHSALAHQSLPDWLGASTFTARSRRPSGWRRSRVADSTSDRSDLGKLQEALQHGSVELAPSQLVHLTAMWIRQKTPAAIVRFGEGEGRLLVADAEDVESISVASNKLRRETGARYSSHGVLEIKSLVMNAFDHADVIGIRGDDSFRDEHRMWIGRIEGVYGSRLAAGRAPAYVAHCLLNTYLRDELAALFVTQPKVTVVSCRDIGSKIAAAYGVEDVRIYQIPSQYIMRNVDDEYEAALHGVRIWPEFYKQLREEIFVRERGEVFLVGAGLVGKDLCIRIRELGGIALDLGSCLDSMAGKVTRGRGRPEPYRPVGL